VPLTRRQVTELLDAHGLRPRRALGQNFVVDPNTVRRIARLAAVGPGSRVLEIGAGLGSLTLALADAGAHVVALEVDAALAAVLRQQVEGRDVTVVEADATTVDWERLLGAQAPSPPAPQGDMARWDVVANLPYNVAVPIVARLLDEAPSVASMLVMVQREVGARLVAGPGSKDYGAVSVKVAYHARAALAGAVPASVFVPRPNVDSVLVRLERRAAVAVDPALVAPERLFAVVRAGFAQRRKMLRRSLEGVVAPGAFEVAGIDPRDRAERLSVQDWGRLAACAAAGGAP